MTSLPVDWLSDEGLWSGAWTRLLIEGSSALVAAMVITLFVRASRILVERATPLGLPSCSRCGHTIRDQGNRDSERCAECGATLRSDRSVAWCTHMRSRRARCAGIWSVASAIGIATLLFASWWLAETRSRFVDPQDPEDRATVVRRWTERLRSTRTRGEALAVVERLYDLSDDVLVASGALGLDLTEALLPLVAVSHHARVVALGALNAELAVQSSPGHERARRLLGSICNQTIQPPEILTIGVPTPCCAEDDFWNVPWALGGRNAEATLLNRDGSVVRETSADHPVIEVVNVESGNSLSFLEIQIGEFVEYGEYRLRLDIGISTWRETNESRDWNQIAGIFRIERDVVVVGQGGDPERSPPDEGFSASGSPIVSLDLVEIGTATLGVLRCQLPLTGPLRAMVGTWTISRGSRRRALENGAEIEIDDLPRSLDEGALPGDVLVGTIPLPLALLAEEGPLRLEFAPEPLAVDPYYPWSRLEGDVEQWPRRSAPMIVPIERVRHRTSREVAMDDRDAPSDWNDELNPDRYRALIPLPARWLDWTR